MNLYAISSNNKGIVYISISYRDKGIKNKSEA